jgi:hypothetical protein
MHYRCAPKKQYRGDKMFKERRNFPRTFVFWRAELVLNGQNSPTPIHATEVSDIGIGLVGDTPLPIGATCTVTLEMEDWQGLPQFLTLDGEIVFGAKSSWTYPFRAGLRFLQPSREKIEMLKQTLRLLDCANGSGVPELA